MTQWNALPITQGSSQAGRLPAALVEGFFSVDEMSFETLLVLAKNIAAHIHYYDHNNEKKGSWAALFSNNEITTMAAIICFEGQKEQVKFRAVLSAGFKPAIVYLLETYREINRWYRDIKTKDNHHIYELQLKFSSVIEKSLANTLEQLLTLISGLDNSYFVLVEETLHEIDLLWGLENSIDECLTALKNDTGLGTVNYKQANKQLHECFTALSNSVKYLQTDTPTYLNKTLTLKSSHEPAFALFLTFLKLFQKAQSKLNHFSARHLDFYYLQLLNFSLKPEKPASTHLILTLAQGKKTAITLDKGTQFSQGKDQFFNDIVYCSDDAIHLSDAKVEQVYSLFLKRDALVSPERELHYVTQILTNELQYGDQSSEIKTNAMTVFGSLSSNSHDEIPYSTESAFRMGFAISDPVLFLNEGQRHITIVIELAEPLSLNSESLAKLNTKPQDIELFKQALTTVFTDMLAADPDLLKTLSIDKTADDICQSLGAEQLAHLFKGEQSKEVAQLYKYFLLGLLQLANKASQFHLLLGRLFSRHTLSCHTWLNASDISLIEQKCKQLPTQAQEPLQRVFRLLKQDKLRTFYELYDDMFDMALSTEQGWYSIDDYNIHPLANEDINLGQQRYGFSFEFTLKAKISPVTVCDPNVHGEAWRHSSPVIRFGIKEQATFFPYSVFRSLVMDKIVIDVEVEGITELVVYNQQGQLDPSKPFNPFGPRPTSHSYFIFGNQEMALKNITDLKINIEWSELPTSYDGFSEYYQAYTQEYQQRYSNDVFKANVSLLKDSEWHIIGKKSGYSLFCSQANSNKIAPKHSLTVELEGNFTGIDFDRYQQTDYVFDFNLKSKNAFFKLSLNQPETAFAHQQYSSLLSQRLIDNAKTKKQKKLPNLPYTPIINRMRLNYKAHSSIRLNQTRAYKANNHITSQGKEIIHIHPFGMSTIYPALKPEHQGRERFLFPRYKHDGNLFIGLSATQLAGIITIFFQLDDQANLPDSSQPTKIEWFYLADDQWRALSDPQIISDTTHGFLSTGIVTLDIPATINTDNTVMPSGLYWLKVATNHNLSGYGHCLHIAAHGVKVTAQEAVLASHKPSVDVSVSKTWTPIKNLIGLGTIQQKTANFDGQLAESNIEFKQRVNERLRHKGRAITAWDYERLILEQFPSLDRVKCLPHRMYGKQGMAPGHILIMVRPKVENCQHQQCKDHRVSAALLINIRDHIKTLSPAFTNIQVYNPEYEQLQVRCAVRFIKNQQNGTSIKRLNNAINDHLCPWHARSINTGFGWLLKVKALEFFIGQLSYVDFVTDLSILHLSQPEHGKIGNHSTDIYHLTDSVNGSELTQKTESTSIKPHQPWSLLMPAAQHHIVSLTEQTIMLPEITGIAELEVGRNFIIKEAEAQQLSHASEPSGETN
ncbi:MAG: hypothetical protein ACJAV1_001148 [Paraglaciecola sp.]|jgi:hypothetical protein